MAGTGTSEKAHARKPRLRIFFTGCHTVFRDPFDNRIIHLLSKKYDIIVDEDNPDLLISSIFGNGWRHYRCKKMYYTGENSFPFMKYFSFSVTYGRTTSKNIRWPLYLMYDEYHRDYREMLLSVSTKATRKDYENRGFCSFVVSNPHGVLRNLFFERLSKRKKVDSGGRYKNNIGGHLEDKKSFLSSYRFNICFENSSSPGYSTEKIIQAFSAKTIPIYWGDPSIATFFNREAFIDLREFKNFDDAIEYILRVDSSPDLWLKYVNSNPFVDSIDPKEYQDEWFLEQFEEKLEHSKVRGRVRKYSPLFMLYMFFQNVWLKYYQLIGPRTFLPYAKNVLAHLAKGKK